jgi:hypothetical protein
MLSFQIRLKFSQVQGDRAFDGVSTLAGIESALPE